MIDSPNLELGANRASPLSVSSDHSPEIWPRSLLKFNIRLTVHSLLADFRSYYPLPNVPMTQV